MSITLTVGGTSVTLPDDLYWSDEFGWSPVQQSTDRSITGALIVSTAARTGGRPITLQPIDNDSAWMQRAVLEQLRAWAAVAGQQMTLLLRGVSRTVIWRHDEAPAIAAEPVVHYSDTDPDDRYTVTLKFLET